ncbi:MAG: glycosyltransferase family 2 protein [Oligosphaeraceae bacterium]|nr:glycosyltransferase family 2 protein [Oligosphaeraceae bacterium]
MSGKKKISVVSSCYNEAYNLHELWERLQKVFAKEPQYDFEFIIADNFSDDGSREILRDLAAQDKRLKVIFNSRNFGHIRSPFNALLKAQGAAVIVLCSDLQEPPELIHDFLRKWEQGAKVVAAVREKTKASFFLELGRRAYYNLLSKFADSGNIIRNFTGFGLYDRCFMQELKRYKDPYPYFRGLVSEIGFQVEEIPFVQEARQGGSSKNNFFTLYDMAMTGFVNHSKLPLRLAMFCGFILALFSFLTAIVYLVYKLTHWHTFALGLAPLLTGLFFFAGVQLIFTGIIGEYLGAIWTQVRQRPLVTEEELLNFNDNKVDEE